MLIAPNNFNYDLLFFFNATSYTEKHVIRTKILMSFFLLSTARIIRTKQWCDMLPCLEGEDCDLLMNKSGWTCTQPGGRIKTTTVNKRCQKAKAICCMLIYYKCITLENVTNTTENAMLYI